ncbi:flippase-like domain-containing protein [bacterium]|nr:flippase-like domain-containing protein [bacterium]NIN92242.1 flippase-like domain-containing protein [bacterium]NIO18381.1 flippase-like domain-containing protein [bacterium]NIO73360.1 flippase-like domain-containing protein [bacterium]
MKRSKWMVVIGILISILFLYLAFRKFDVAEGKRALKMANYYWLLPAVISYMFGFWMRGIRWRYLLLPIKKCKIFNLVSTVFIGFMANNLLPLRVGELIRAYVNGKKENISKSSSLATIVVERVFDGLALVILLLVAILFLGRGSSAQHSFPQWLKKMIYVAWALFLTVLILLYTMMRSKELTGKIVRKLFGFLKEPILKKILNLADSFIEGLNVLRQRKEILIVSCLSLLVWTLEGATFYLGAKALNLSISYPQAYFTMVVIALGVMIPSSPSFVGVYEYFCITALALFAIDRSLALSYAVLVHFLQFSLLVSLGLFFLWKENLSLGKLKKEASDYSSR